MIKKLLTPILALSLAATSTIFLLPASAEEDEADKANLVEIKIRANMPEEWLKEHDEFDITFEHDGEKKYVFFDKDNKFERWTEIEKNVEYNVIFSDDMDGYEIAGIGDTYTLTKDNDTIILAFKKKGEKKTESKADSKEDKNDDKTEDTEGEGMLLSSDKLTEYQEQRKLVQEFIDVVDNEEIWHGFSYENNAEEANRFFEVCSPCLLHNNFYEYDSEARELARGNYKEFFIISHLYLNEKYAFGNFGMYNTNEEDKRGLKIFNLGDDELNLYPNINLCASELYPSVLKVWKYSQEKFYETGEVPDLYAVYLDIKNGVNYVEEPEPTDIDEPSSEEIPEVESEQDEDESSFDEQPEISPESETAQEPAEISSAALDNSDEGVYYIPPKKSFGDVLKDNIVTIILGAGLIVAVIIIINMSKKNKKNS